MRRISFALVVASMLAASPALARVASSLQAARDTLGRISPVDVIVSPAQPCDRDSVALLVQYCNTCSRLLHSERVSPSHLIVFLTTRVDSDTTWNRVDCPLMACPYPSVHAEMGGYTPGPHDVDVETVTQVVLPDSSSFLVSDHATVSFVVSDTCGPPPPPPPPPPDVLPFVRVIEIGAVPPCGDHPVVCPNDSIPVLIAGVFPNDCMSVRRIDLIPSPLMDPLPHPPLVRILVDDGACLGRPCVGGEFPWSERLKITGMLPGAYRLPVKLGTASCTDTFPNDSTVHFVLLPFTVVQKCSTQTAERCLIPQWEHPNPDRPCDDFVSADHPANLILDVRSSVALSGLQGRLRIVDLVVNSPARPGDSQTGLLPALAITALEPIGLAAGMHLQWSPDGGGAKFLMFADTGAPIPPAPLGPDSLSVIPVLRVTVSATGTGPIGRVTGVVALDALGADSLGGGVPTCLPPCGPPISLARICGTVQNCDVNGDGVLDVRDLVTMVHCVLHTGSCPDTSGAAFDCNRDSTLSLDDVLCCGAAILRGHLPDSTGGRPAPGISVEFGDPTSTAAGVDVPLVLSGGYDIGAARLALDFPEDRFDVTSVSLDGEHRDWLELHERQADQFVIGLIHIPVISPVLGPTPADQVHLTLHFALKPGASPSGMVTVAQGDFSDPVGAALHVNLGQPAQSLGDESLGLSAIQPNPFGREARFAVKLARAASVELEVHDLVGRRITTLHHGTLPAGTRVFTWDGRDSNGSRAANGIYFVRLVQDGKITARKVVLVREP
jgi:hypothetical protein